MASNRLFREPHGPSEPHAYGRHYAKPKLFFIFDTVILAQYICTVVKDN